jgi:hypothetical protein
VPEGVGPETGADLETEFQNEEGAFKRKPTEEKKFGVRFLESAFSGGS